MNPYRLAAVLPAPPTPPPPRLYAVAAAFGILCVVVGCWPVAKTADSAIFAAELEACMQTSASCADYVTCQHRVQQRWDQPLSGSCDVVSDGGAP